MILNPGTVLRFRNDPNDFWRVERLTPKSAVMVRCDAEGKTGPYEPSKWTFRLTTVARDFFPA